MGTKQSALAKESEANRERKVKESKDRNIHLENLKQKWINENIDKYAKELQSIINEFINKAVSNGERYCIILHNKKETRHSGDPNGTVSTIPEYEQKIRFGILLEQKRISVPDGARIYVTSESYIRRWEPSEMSLKIDKFFGATLYDDECICIYW